MSTALRAAFALFILLGAVPGSQAEDRAKARVERANAGTITIIASSLEAPYINYAQDLADVLDDGNDLRILPIVGKGPVQTLTDLIYLKGVDAGIVPADVLAYVEDNALFEGASEKLAYLAKFGSSQVHVVASQGITTLAQLEGKRINIGRATDDRFVTANVILNDAGINYTADDSDPATALAMLKAGKLDAVFLVEPSPSPYLAASHGIERRAGAADREAQERFIPLPFSPRASIRNCWRSRDPRKRVSVSSVLAVFKWRKGTERYDTLVRFAQALYSQIDLLRMPSRHAAWAEVNLAASVPGWQRYIAAEEWLAGKLPKPKTTEEEPVASEADFKAFLAESGLPPNTPEGGEDALFERFVKWQQARGELPSNR